MNNGTIIEDLETSSLSNALKITNGVQIDKEYDEALDLNQYIGWNQRTSWDPLTTMLFSKKTLRLIRDKVSEYTIGVDQKGRKIIPSDNVVVTALYGVFENYHPQTGDIYGKYLVVDMTQRDDYTAIVDQTISLIIRGITTDLGMIEQNNKLTIWDTVLGDFNSQGLRSHPPIKIRERRPDPMLFNMHY
jgi:hypothetical protein